MDSIPSTLRLRSMGLPRISINYYFPSISTLIALSLLQFHLISHVVDSFPSAASKQDSQHDNRPYQSGSRSSVDSIVDKIDIDSYLKNHKALKLQIQCIVYDGPCDYVGRWLKPRIRTALLGDCYSCTEKQKNQIGKIVDYIQITFPEEFKIGVKKYLLSVGLDVPEEITSTSTTSSISLLNPNSSAEVITTTAAEPVNIL